MAIRFATQAGNWSDPSIWDGGTTIPTTGDEVYSNNFRITIDVSTIDVSYLTNGSEVGINAGGGFNLDVSCVFNCDFIWHNATNVIANHLLHIIGTSVITVEINGNFVWRGSGTLLATTANVIRIENPNSTTEFNATGVIERTPLGQNVNIYLFRLFEGELTINGDIRHFGNVSTHHLILVGGLNVSTPPKLNINGNFIQEQTATNGVPLFIGAAGVDGIEVNIIGDVNQITSNGIFWVSGSHTNTITVNHFGDYTINNAFTTIQFLRSDNTLPNLTINWTGSIIRNLFGISTILGSGVRNITTNLNHQLSTANDILQVSTSSGIVVNLYGNLEGGNVANARAFSIQASTNPTVNIFGNVIGGNSTTTTVGRYDQHPFGFASTVVVNAIVGGEIVAIGSPNSDGIGLWFRGVNGRCVIERAITGDAPWYANPFIGNVVFEPVNPQYEVVLNDGNDTKLVLTDPTLDDYPVESNVRDGIKYAFDNLEGTCVVPDPVDVRKGIGVDNTVGTAVLDADDFFDIIKTSSDPLAERLRNVATTQIVGDQFNSFK
jgi:hypothetical protein